jgi:hypothetical protein
MHMQQTIRVVFFLFFFSNIHNAHTLLTLLPPITVPQHSSSCFFRLSHARGMADLDGKNQPKDKHC